VVAAAAAQIWSSFVAVVVVVVVVVVDGSLLLLPSLLRYLRRARPILLVRSHTLTCAGDHRFR